MKRVLLGFVAGIALSGLVGYLIAFAITCFELLQVEHLEFHLAFWCAMHGAVLGANIGMSGWREAVLVWNCDQNANDS